MLATLLLLITVQSAPPFAAMIWGQSTCTGIDSGATGETTQTHGNQRPRETSWSTYGLSMTDPVAWPLEDLTEYSRCPLPTASIYTGCGNLIDLGGGRKQFADYWSVATGQPITVASNAIAGVPYRAYYRKAANSHYPYMRAFLEAQGARVPGVEYVGTFGCHGEADYNESGDQSLAGVLATQAMYKADMEELQSDLESDVHKTIPSSASRTVPLFLTQWASCQYVGAGYAVALACGSIQGILNAVRANPGKIIGVAPSYQHTYCSGPHMCMASNRMRFAKMAEAAVAVHEGRGWTGLWTTGVERVGNAYRLTYNVPFPPMVFDTTTISDPGSYGFSYYEDLVKKSINTPELCTGAGAPNAICQNATQIIITPTATPAGTSRDVRYGDGPVTALTMPGNTAMGARGNLRDSDPATWNNNMAEPPSHSLWNWAWVEYRSVP